MIRLRVSSIESFRRVVATPYGDEAELCERIVRGQWADHAANYQMRVGTAFHAVLADPIRHGQIEADAAGVPTQVYRSGDFTFAGADVQRALAHVGPGACELTGRATFDVGGRAVEVEGTCDRIRGLLVRDAKVKFAPADARDYEASLQWRFYLAIHGAAAFAYDLFACRCSDPAGGRCDIGDITTFRFWRYPNLDADLRGWLADFLAWTDARGLTGHLERDGRNAAA